jgi:LuxR family maltose regulon positive regulatory protein
MAADHAPGQRPLAPMSALPPPLPLLVTKQAIPAPAPTLVSRARLTTRLQTRAACRLALVVAPAGSGKSSLISQWCQQRAADRVAWLSLDARDNEPIRFLRYLCAALESIAPEVGADIERRCASVSEQAIAETWR